MAQREFTSPARKLTRKILRFLARPAFGLLTRLEISGVENLPEKGPLIMVGNHFSFVDPVCFVRIAPWEIEFVGGADMPHAPLVSRIIPLLWGYHPLYRGTGAKDSLKTAEGILEQDGILGIFPEAGNWATVLRPARPGTAFLASRSGAPLLPVGLIGMNDIFPSLKRGRRARIQINIGKPFGPFRAEGHGQKHREQLDEIGHVIMHHIAQLIPQEKRGHYSDDLSIREAAKGTEIYPWADKIEGQVTGTVR
ncbi:MAG TPA: lysophospholipid acyltransferase family protein [Anaerolineales bacterium]|nr:lysophospholipid acyltransferase family protein [Anaerolineales bacterium]